MSYVSHHYLPQTYLRRFILPKTGKTLWECDKSTFEFTKSTPRESGCEDYYHAFTKKDGTLDTESIEQDLGRIETNIDWVYKAIRGERELTPKEWSYFYLFAASMMVRVPSFVKQLQDFSTAVYQTSFDIMRSNPENLKKWQEMGIPAEVVQNCKVTADHGVSLLMCLDSMKTPRQLFSRMGWRFLKAPKGSYFITGDRPISYRSPGETNTLFPPGLATQDIEVLFPLSKSACALGAWITVEPPYYYEVDARVVRRVNCRVAQAAKKFLYGPRNDLNDFCLVVRPDSTGGTGSAVSCENPPAS